MARKKIRMGLAGFGLSAQVFHLPFIEADGRFEIRRVFERKGSQSQLKLPQAKIVREFAELLTDNIDVVLITTPNQTHFQFAKEALLMGKYVVVEKPLCASVAEAKQLSELAQAQSVV